MNMSKKYLNQAPFWLNLLNHALKTLLVISLIIFSFFGQWSGVLVEGYPTVIIDNGPLSLSPAPQKETSSLFTTSFLALNTLPSYKKIEITVTGYSSTPEQTDDTPFITASGKVVEDGIIAANFLDFGTKVRFPELFGDKIFIVEDRMHEKFSNDRVDIWFPTTEEAKNFGIKKTIMEIIEEPESH
jgi:3D (Asp-Asp-Asp) domain-containing protein